MSETINTNQGEVQESTPWDSLVLNSDKTRKAEYLQSKKGQEETAIEDTFDQWAKELDEMVEEGKISKEEARKQQEAMLESAVNGIYSVRSEALRDQQQEAQTDAPIAENIETKTIKRRVVEEKPEKGANQEPVDTPETTPVSTSNVARDRLNQMREMLAETPEEPIEETAPVPEYDPTIDIPSVDTPESIEEELAKEKTDFEQLEDDTDRLITDVTDLFGEQTKHPESIELTEEEQLRAEREAINSKLGEIDGVELTEEEQLRAEAEAIRAKLAELGEEQAETPLVAVDVDFTHDKHELARDLAERDLNEETAKAGFIKRLWKGTLFKKYYHKKYTREYIEEERASTVGGEKLSVYDLVARRSEGAIKRFVLGATEDMRYIHTRIGEKRKDGTYDGEKLVEADEKTTAELRTAIEKFASAKIPEGGSLEDLKLDFSNEIARLKAEARDEGRSVDGYTIDNYLEVAIQARERVEHGIAMERVMEGFKAYRAEARDSVRTEAHRDNLDKIINRLESGKIGQFIPAEVLAGAVSIAYALTQTGARALAGAGGGIVVSSALAGLKERNRVTEDRARMLRDVANGMEYGNSNSPKTRKYESKIAGTVYDLRPASELTSGIEAAMQFEGEGHTMAILQAIAEARVRIDVSDHERKDLIAYSSEDKRGDERLALDMAVIRAEKTLSEEDKSKLVEMRKAIEESMLEQIDEKDKDFKHRRAVLAAKKAGKTLLVGAATFFASQEIMAAIDPTKIGILEKYGILNTKNTDNASETLLASGFGLNRGNQVISENITSTEYVTDISGDQEAEIARLESEGFTKTTVREAYTELPDQPNDYENIEVDSLPRSMFKYDGWANNGTTVSDGNELRAYLTPDGQFISGMHGNSTMGDQVFNYDELLNAGRIKAFLTLGDHKFELVGKLNDAGQLTWGENGVFTTVGGETIKAIGDNGEKLYRYFEIGLDNGFDAEGIQHIIPFATDAGRNEIASSVVQKAIRVPKVIPALYNFTRTIASATERIIPREIFTNGVFVPETARTGLGGPRASETIREQQPTILETNNQPIAPETPEASPSSPELGIENPERQTKTSDSLKNLINNNPTLFGGEESASILTGLAKETDETRYSEWWNNLDDATKSRIYGVVEAMNDRADGGPDWGQAAREWIISQPR